MILIAQNLSDHLFDLVQSPGQKVLGTQAAGGDGAERQVEERGMAIGAERGDIKAEAQDGDRQRVRKINGRRDGKAGENEGEGQPRQGVSLRNASRRVAGCLVRRMLSARAVWTLEIATNMAGRA